MLLYRWHSWIWFLCVGSSFEHRMLVWSCWAGVSISRWSGEQVGRDWILQGKVFLLHNHGISTRFESDITVLQWIISCTPTCLKTWVFAPSFREITGNQYANMRNIIKLKNLICLHHYLWYLTTFFVTNCTIFSLLE